MALSVDQLSDIVRHWAASDVQIARVHIFGSRARNEEREDSDLDVAIEFKPRFNDLSNWIIRAGELRNSLQPLLPCELQLEWYGGPEETPTIHRGMEQGLLTVYESAT